MPTPYEVLYENILLKFRSYEIPNMTEIEVKELLQDYLKPAIAKFHVCRQDLNDRNDELEQFNCELTNSEVEILSNYALLEYLDATYIRTPTLLKVNLSSSDFNAFSPANMLDKLMEMHKTYLSENETLLSRYAWLSSAGKLDKLSAGYRKK